MLPQDSILYASDSRGIYIPRYFAESINRDCVSGIGNENFEILSQGPEADYYWEVWDEVMRRCVLTCPKTGVKYYLWQDGDLWLVPCGAEWGEE